MRALACIAALALCAASATAGAAVFRCTDAAGRITYQDSACDGNASTHPTNIPTDYPPPNEAERARILQREADLERRLEARREREAREESVRLASAPAAAAEPAVNDVYPLYYPIAMPRAYARHHANAHERGNARPRPVPLR
ncbi:MAG TPA: DUF4124 domain-containing protein [Usitatibacter sp.]|jgi:hypothetical protein|nr:DUF4124 domain-containing protein [Usitatibacter sp.]